MSKCGQKNLYTSQLGVESWSPSTILLCHFTIRNFSAAYIWDYYNWYLLGTLYNDSTKTSNKVYFEKTQNLKNFFDFSQNRKFQR